MSNVQDVVSVHISTSPHQFLLYPYLSGFFTSLPYDVRISLGVSDPLVDDEVNTLGIDDGTVGFDGDSVDGFLFGLS